MLSRNRTAFTFLASLSEGDEETVFSSSSVKAASVRKLHKQQEQQASLHKQQHLREVKENKVNPEEKKRKQTEAVLHRVKIHNGPCPGQQRM